MASLVNARRSTSRTNARAARLQIERLEERALLAVFAGAMGDSYSDEYAPLAAGLRNWVEILDASGQADFGPIVTSYSANDPRGTFNFPSHEFNFAVGGANSNSYLGDGAPFYLDSQTGSPTLPGLWGGFRAAALAGNIEYGLLEIGGNDLLGGSVNGTFTGPGPYTATPPNGTTTAAIDAVIGRIAEGLDIATGGSGNQVKMVLTNLLDLGSAPYAVWDIVGLTPQHRANLRSHVELFNSKLETLAADRGLPVLSLWDWWEDARLNGLVIGSTQIDVLTPAPPGGGLEELDHFFLNDGIHPTPIAQGLVGNRFLDAIANHYGETEVSPLSEAELLQLTGLDSTPPTVVDVFVSGANWGVGPYSIMQNPGELLPLANVDQIEIVFSEEVDVSESDLSLTGVVTASYGFAGPPTTGPGPNAGEFSALWTLGAPLGTDKLLVQIAGTITDSAGLAIGGQPDHRFDVVPGDANRDGTVGPADYTIWSNEFGTTHAMLNLDQGDFDADGVTGPSEYTTWANHFGQSLPGGEPMAAAASSGPELSRSLATTASSNEAAFSPIAHSGYPIAGVANGAVLVPSTSSKAIFVPASILAIVGAMPESSGPSNTEGRLPATMVDAALVTVRPNYDSAIRKESAIRAAARFGPLQQGDDPLALSLLATTQSQMRDAELARLWDRAIAELFGTDDESLNA